MQSCVLTRRMPHERVRLWHDPSKCPNVHPFAGVEWSSTRECSGKIARQTPGQWMPRGVLVTVPCPWFATNTTIRRLFGAADDDDTASTPATTTAPSTRTKNVTTDTIARPSPTNTRMRGC